MTRRKPIIPHILVSGLAGAALVALWVGNPLESTAETVDEPAAQAAVVAAPQVAAAATLVAPVQLAVATTPARPALEIPTDAPTAKPATATPEIAMVEVPDVSRMNAWEARKALKSAGLKFSFRDGGSRVHHEDYDFYRVREQSLKAGARVAAGTRVTMQVRERRFASGY